MVEKFKFENKREKPEGDLDFQGRYEPAEVTLEELREKMRRVVEKEEGKE
jgi:hypothetical protein